MPEKFDISKPLNVIASYLGTKWIEKEHDCISLKKMLLSFKVQ